MRHPPTSSKLRASEAPAIAYGKGRYFFINGAIFIATFDVA